MTRHDCLFKARLGFVLMFFPSLMFLGAGCDSNSTVPPSFIDQSIVLETSDRVAGTETAPNEFAFDLSSLSLVASRMFNEIEISYITPDGGDRLVYIYNFDTDQWDQVGFPCGFPRDCVFIASPTTHHNTVRDLLGDVQPYVNPDGMVTLMSEVATPLEVRVLRLLENYRAVRPFGEGNLNIFDGLTYDGEFFWASSNFSNRLYLIDDEGTVVSEFDAPGDSPFDLAFDGQNVWLADGSDRIFKMSLDGAVTGEFTVPTDFPGGLAWGAGSLWLSEYAGPDLRTFRIDPDASVTTGVAVVTNVFQTPGGENLGLAWNGEHLLILNDALYVVTVDGAIVQSYALPVVYPTGLAWDGQAVVMFSRGPEGVGNDGVKLNRFRLR